MLIDKKTVVLIHVIQEKNPFPAGHLWTVFRRLMDGCRFKDDYSVSMIPSVEEYIQENPGPHAYNSQGES